MMASSRGSILSTLPLIIGRWRGIIWGYALVVCSKWIRRAWSTLERNQHFVGVWPKWRRKSIHHYHVTCVAFNVSFSSSQVLCVMTVLLWMKRNVFYFLDGRRKVSIFESTEQLEELWYDWVQDRRFISSTNDLILNRYLEKIHSFISFSLYIHYIDVRV